MARSTTGGANASSTGIAKSSAGQAKATARKATSNPKAPKVKPNKKQTATILPIKGGNRKGSM